MGARNIVYTRYADDMTFSAKSPELLLRAMVTIKAIIESEQFTVNEKKTRLLGPRQQQKVTGIVISNDKQLGIGKKQKKVLRAAIYNLIMKPMGKNERQQKMLWILGWLSYLKSIDKHSCNELTVYGKRLLTSIQVNTPQRSKIIKNMLARFV
ncbi:MAG: retron RNA-directed polymerase-like protein [Firmicutes bacterium]|nr:retron RNA-directed polymerase-like protein [Bacillota bacterium]